MSTVSEPAIKSYFFGKGYQDLKDVIIESWSSNWTSAQTYFSKIDTTGEVWESALSIAYWGGAGVSVVIFGTIFFTALSLLHISFLGLFFSLIYIGFSIVWTVERTFLFIRGFGPVCPHCHKKATLPEYLCDKCGNIHTMLMPNSYGILSHKCLCGQKLPGTFFLDRGRLQARCSACHQLLNREHVESRKILIPIVGGPSVGKTAFMFTAVRKLIEEKTKELSFDATFIDKTTEAEYQQVVNQLQQGKVPNKTTTHIPKAFNLALKRDGNTRWFLYIYDPAGEAYQNTEHLTSHQYHGYLSGMIMIIDPFSIPNVLQKYEQQLTEVLAEIKPSQGILEDTLDRVVLTMEESFGLSKTGQIKKPLAVVISKIDAFDLNDIIGEPAVDKAFARGIHQSTKNQVRNDLIRKQLIKWGEEALVQKIDTRFKTVNFFSCSAFGRIPNQSNKDFIPIHVLDPLLWILQSVNRKDFS